MSVYFITCTAVGIVVKNKKRIKELNLSLSYVNLLEILILLYLISYPTSFESKIKFIIALLIPMNIKYASLFGIYCSYSPQFT